MLLTAFNGHLYWDISEIQLTLWYLLWLHQSTPPSICVYKPICISDVFAVALSRKGCFLATEGPALITRYYWVSKLHARADYDDGFNELLNGLLQDVYGFVMNHNGD